MLLKDLASVSHRVSLPTSGQRHRKRLTRPLSTDIICPASPQATHFLFISYGFRIWYPSGYDAVGSCISMTLELVGIGPSA
jgi:hypothetical protein